MSPGLLLFFLRILMGVALFAFLVTLLIMLRRDLQQSAPRTVIVPRASLILRGDNVEHLEYPLERINLVGRAADNTIVFGEEAVSAHHARLTYVSGRQWWLEDLGSRNGTFVNGIPVEQPLVVTDGDVIVFGKVDCVINVEESVEPPEITALLNSDPHNE